MKAFHRKIGCIVFFVLAIPPVGMAVFYLYGLATPAQTLLLSHALPLRQLLIAIPMLTPITAFAGLVFTALAFGRTPLRPHLHRWPISAVTGALAVAAPFLVILLLRLAHGDGPSRPGLIFLAMGLVTGALLGLIIPSRFLPDKELIP